MRETEKERIPLPYPAAEITAENVNAARDHHCRRTPKNSRICVFPESANLLN